MRLEAITAEVRPRTTWEAIDLGWAMTRVSFAGILRAMIVLVWPVWILILLLCREQLFWGLFLIWWTKPLAERVPLYLMSRKLFGEAVSTGGLLRRYYHVWVRHLFFALVTGRFSVARSTLAPIRELEMLRGKNYRVRAARILSRCGGASWWMQIVHLILLHSLWASILLLVYVMIPERYAPDLGLWFEERFRSDAAMPPWFLWCWAGLYLVALTLVTPLYAGAGFGIYLNARTRLEGWDIELAFRKMAARLEKAATSVAAGVVLALTLCGGGDASAQDAAGRGSEVELIGEILAEPEFKIHTRTEYRPITPETPRPGWWDGLPLLNLFGMLQILADVILWTVVALAVGAIAYFLVRAMAAHQGGTKDGATREVVKTVAGLNVELASLPRDIVAAARDLLAAGKAEEAAALLYRGAISWLVHQARIPIRESDTEADCLDEVRRSALPMVEYFEALTRVRVATAYGKAEADRTLLERLLVEWPFGKQPTNSAG